MIYFFKQRKLNKLYNRKGKLETQKMNCKNQGDIAILEAKLEDVEIEIQTITKEIKDRNLS